MSDDQNNLKIGGMNVEEFIKSLEGKHSPEEIASMKSRLEEFAKRGDEIYETLPRIPISHLLAAKENPQWTIERALACMRNEKVSKAAFMNPLTGKTAIIRSPLHLRIQWSIERAVRKLIDITHWRPWR